MAENKLADLSMDFAVSILKLTNNIKGDYSLTNQLERSATSIGANIREVKYAHSKADFISKLQIALKECYETKYWLELLQRAEMLTDGNLKSFMRDCGAIRKMLISSINTTKANEGELIMKITKFYNPEIPYSLHDMNVIEFEINGDNLIMRTQSGMMRTAPHWDQVDGYLEFLDVNWEYCYATICEGYYGNIGTYEGKTFKKMYLKDFIAEFQNAGFSITDEYYGQDRALYTGYFHRGNTMGECTIEIHHNNILFCEQTDDTREMKEVILSADGDLSLYLVPADVADNLATVANEFAFTYVWFGEKSGKFLRLCGEQYAACFNEEDFIEYLNTVLYPDKPSTKIKTIGVFDDEKELPEEYRDIPYYNF